MSKSFDLVFLVSNDITTDRRLFRITRTLSRAGYSILVVGRLLDHSHPINWSHCDAYRIKCLFRQGPIFYLELNIRMIWFLKRISFSGITSNDLDTVLPGWLYKKWKSRFFAFDAHELFTEVPELESKRIKRACWRALGQMCVPSADLCYTVSPGIAHILQQRYRKQFGLVRNLPYQLKKRPFNGPLVRTRLVYLGVLNAGRGLPELFEALKQTENVELDLAGSGDIQSELEILSQHPTLNGRVRFVGVVPPGEIGDFLKGASIGVHLLDSSSQSYKLSLANKFFDYIQHGIPVLTMEFEEYKKVNDHFRCGILLKTLDIQEIVQAISLITANRELRNELVENCREAAIFYCWEQEENNLLVLYRSHLQSSTR